MQISRRVDYALRALAYLAGQADGRVVGRAEIEARQGIPHSFLAKILRLLVGAGLLESVTGARGGFRLRRAATDISIGAVYEAVEGELRVIDCLRGGVCRFEPVCGQNDVWRGAQQRLRAYLDGISIAALADPRGLRARAAGGDVTGGSPRPPRHPFVTT